MSRAAQIGRIVPLIDAFRNRASPASEYDIPEELLAMANVFHSGSSMTNNMNSRASHEKDFQRTSLTNSSLATQKIVPHWTWCSNGAVDASDQAHRHTKDCCQRGRLAHLTKGDIADRYSNTHLTKMTREAGYEIKFIPKYHCGALWWQHW